MKNWWGLNLGPLILKSNVLPMKHVTELTVLTVPAQ